MYWKEPEKLTSRLSWMIRDCCVGVQQAGWAGGLGNGALREGFVHPSALFPLRRQLFTVTHLKAGPRGGWFKDYGNNVSGSGVQALVTLPHHPSGPARDRGLGLGQRGAHRNVDLPYRQAATSSNPPGGG